MATNWHKSDSGDIQCKPSAPSVKSTGMGRSYTDSQLAQLRTLVLEGYSQHHSLKVSGVNSNGFYKLIKNDKQCREAYDRGKILGFKDTAARVSNQKEIYDKVADGIKALRRTCKTYDQVARSTICIAVGEDLNGQPYQIQLILERENLMPTSGDELKI